MCHIFTYDFENVVTPGFFQGIFKEKGEE